MFIKKLLSGLINVVFIIFFIIFFITPKEKRKFIIFLFIITYFFSTPIGSNVAIYPLEKDYLNQYFLYYSLITNPEKTITMYKDVDKIIVLAGGINDNKELSKDSMSRIITAIIIYKSLKETYNKTPEIIILGGDINKDNQTAKQMKLLIEKFEKAKIREDIDSLDTYQNVLNLKKIINEKDKILVVTSAFHMKRAKITFYNIFNEKFVKYNVIFVPCSFRYKLYLNVYDLIPSFTYFSITNLAIREMIGILYYRIYLKINKNK